MYKENVELLLDEADYMKNRDDKRQRYLMLLLPQSLTLMIGLRLPSTVSWRTMTGEAATFHLLTLKLSGISCIIQRYLQQSSQSNQTKENTSEETKVK